TANKENQELIEVLTEAVSDDFFVYGGKAWGDFYRLIGKLDTVRQLAPLGAVIGGSDPFKMMMRHVLLTAQKNRELLVFPDPVLGFKPKDTKRAAAQSGRLEMHAKALLEMVPPLKGRLTKKKIGEGNFLALDLDGTLVPWEDLNLKDFEENKDEFDELIKHL